MSCDKYSENEKEYLANEYPTPLNKCNMPLGGNDGSAMSLEQAIQWLNKCRDTHPNCGPTDLSFCPSRLLELGGFESGSPDILQVKLIETKQMSTGMAYACLSHCWGGITPACVTNKDTIQAYLSGISWSKIPRTFQDAMVLTWRLGFQYIWIDSLCILQDDEENWRKEAATMASVYSNSSITIAATSSADCRQGLYRADPSRVKVHELEILISNQRPARVLMYSVSGGVDWTGHRAYEQTQAGTKRPLLERAWFFQEWHLSPRLLHFDEGEIIWQCRCGSLSQHEAFEGCPFPHPAAEQFEDASSTGEKASPKLMPKDGWLQAVGAYSRLKLTFREKDILAAISGVAKKTEQFKLGYTYAAGIWLESLLRELCWEACWPSVSSRLNEWAAPSWSWASVDGPVRYNTHFYDAHKSIWDEKCVIHNVTCILAGEDATGPLKDASLTVSGHATRCTLEYDLEGRNVGGSRYSIRIRWLRSLIDFAPDYALNQPGGHNLAPGSSLECLYLLRRNDCVVDDNSAQNLLWGVFLILTESKRKKGAYERIGLLEIRDYYIKAAIERASRYARSTFVIV